MKKKKICLITNWYPTKENPYQGVFFKEQAFVMEENYDFLVIHYAEKIRKRPWMKTTVVLANREKNTTEYNVETYIPLRMAFMDILENLKHRISGVNNVEGVGDYVSKARKKLTKEKIINIFEQHFKGQFDVLYCVDAQKEAYYLQCLAEHFGKPYVIGEHAPVPWPGTTLKDTEKNAIENANLFLAISQDKIRQMMLQNICLPEVRYIGNLVDEDMLVLKPKEHAVKTLMIMAAHSFYKNYSMFLKVMERLLQITNCPFKIMIVGYAANKGYSKNIAAFEQIIHESSIGGITEMIPSVPHNEISDYLNRADAFIMTSIQEGQPVSAMEAACCGLPVFSTRCGGVEDYVDEAIGRIYALTDVEGMALGLKDFLEGKIHFEASKIRKRVVEKFGKRAFITNFHQAFMSVMPDDE